MKLFTKFAAASLASVALLGLSANNAQAASSYKTVAHNAYGYNASGKRIANKKYYAGSCVKTIGQARIGGKKYYILPGGVFVKAANFNVHAASGYKTKMIHNAFIYNAKGVRIGRTKLYKGQRVICYGNPKRIRGKKYIRIGTGRYVRLSNVLYYAAGTDNGQLTEPDNQNRNSKPVNNPVQPTQASQTSNASKPTQTTQASNVQPTKPTNPASPTTPVTPSTPQQPTQASQTTSAIENSSAKPTQAEWNTLGDKIYDAEQLWPAAVNYASSDVRDGFVLSEDRAQYVERNHTSATEGDVIKATNDLDKAINSTNDNINANDAALPRVTSNPAGTLAKFLTEDQRQKVLSIINDIAGSNDARFKDQQTIIVTGPGGMVQSYDLSQYIRQAKK